MRRVFIIRKDLHLTPGKLASQVGHCCEAYWTNLLKRNFHERNDAAKVECCHCDIDADVWDDYVNGIYTKTICESRNLSHLLKAKAIADELGLKENVDYGFINDKCLTELKPENDDETTTVGMWFAPLEDEVAHKISKNYPLLKEHKNDKEIDKGEKQSTPYENPFGKHPPDWVAVSLRCALKEKADKDEAMRLTESERTRRFQEVCKQSEGGLQTFK